MNNTFPTVGTTVADLAQAIGGTVIGTITESIVVILPILAVLWAIRFVLKKVGFGSK